MITIRNDTHKTRSLVFTSYAEVVLAPSIEDEQHLAFSKLFVESEYLPEFRRDRPSPSIAYTQISTSLTFFTGWCPIRAPRHFLELKVIDLASSGVPGLLVVPPWPVGAYPEPSALALTPS